MQAIDTARQIYLGGVGSDTYLTKEASEGVVEQLRRHCNDPALNFDIAERVCLFYYRLKRKLPKVTLHGNEERLTLQPYVLSLVGWYSPRMSIIGDLPETLYLRQDKEGAVAHTYDW